MVMSILHACEYHLGLDLVSDLDQAGEITIENVMGSSVPVLCCSFKVIVSLSLMFIKNSKLAGPF